MKLTHAERKQRRDEQSRAKKAKRCRRECTEYNPNRTDSPPKKRYKDPDEAKRDRQMTFIMDPSRGPVKIFPCVACGGYHIGHPRYDLA